MFNFKWIKLELQFLNCTSHIMNGQLSRMAIGCCTNVKEFQNSFFTEESSTEQWPLYFLWIHYPFGTCHSFSHKPKAHSLSFVMKILTFPRCFNSSDCITLFNKKITNYWVKIVLAEILGLPFLPYLLLSVLNHKIGMTIISAFTKWDLNCENLLWASRKG